MTVRPPVDTPAAEADLQQQVLDFLRVLRNAPAVGELGHLDLAGKEQLRVSRLEPDVVGSQEDFSRAPKFVEARAGKMYWSPVYFKNDASYNVLTSTIVSFTFWSLKNLATCLVASAAGPLMISMFFAGL